jgi:hypothetical protein
MEEEEEKKNQTDRKSKKYKLFFVFLMKKIKNKVLVLLISLFVFLTQKRDFVDPAGFFTSVKMKIIEKFKSYITTNRHYSN